MDLTHQSCDIVPVQIALRTQLEGSVEQSIFGKSYRRKQMFILKWTAAAALVFGLLAAGLIWWFSNPLH